MTSARPGVLTAGTVILLSALYFAQGLPFGFFTQAVPVVLRESGYSLIAISATSLLFAPWALKFLWAPYVDRYGSRRRWLLCLQCSAALIALGMAGLDLSGSMTWLFVGIAVINLISATQDVATDGLAVNLLGPKQRGVGNGIQVGAYRVGMIVGGGGLLWLFAFAGWRTLFIVMALLLAASTIPVLFSSVAAQRSAGQAPAPPPVALMAGWWHRLRRPGVVVFIVLIAVYKFGNSMGSILVGPFMIDAGLSVDEVALIKGVLSSAGALAGAAIGGWIAYSLGRRRALLVGGITQTLSLGLYVIAAQGIGGFPLIVSASLAEHIFGGIATVAVFTLMMDAADRAFAGSDYTLFASAIVIVQGVAALGAGLLGELFGFSVVFLIAAVASAIGCAVMLASLDRGFGPAGLRTVVPVRHGPRADQR